MPKWGEKSHLLKGHIHGNPGGGNHPKKPFSRCLENRGTWEQADVEHPIHKLTPSTYNLIVIVNASPWNYTKVLSNRSKRQTLRGTAGDQNKTFMPALRWVSLITRWVSWYGADRQCWTNGPSIVQIWYDLAVHSGWRWKQPWRGSDGCQEGKAEEAEAKCWIVLQNPVKLVLGHNVTEARGKHQEATQLTEDKSLIPAYSARNWKKIQVVPISKAGQPKPWLWLP